jgi:hypothetical protein
MLPTSQAQALVRTGYPCLSTRRSKETIFDGKIETQGHWRISDAVLEEYWKGDYCFYTGGVGAGGLWARLGRISRLHFWTNSAMAPLLGADSIEGE